MLGEIKVLSYYLSYFGFVSMMGTLPVEHETEAHGASPCPPHLVMRACITPSCPQDMVLTGLWILAPQRC